MEKGVQLTNLQNWLESNGGWTLADLDKMPIRKKNEGDPEEEQHYVPRKGFVKIVGAKPRKLANGTNSQNNFQRKCVWDNDRRIVYGQPIGTNKDGSPRWKSVIIDDERQFDLSKTGDRRDFYVILHCEDLVDGPNYKGTPKMKMLDPEKAANEAITKRTLVRSADEIVRNLSNEMGMSDLSDFATLFGINPQQSDSIIHQQLYERADSDPNAIVDRWNNPDRRIWTLVKKAMMFGVIELKPDGLYYGGLAMGASEINAVERIKKQPELATTINDMVNTKLGKGKTVIPIAKKSENQVFEAALPKQPKTPKPNPEEVKEEEGFGS